MAGFPDENYNWVGLSGGRADFPDETHNWTDLSGKDNIFPDNNVIIRISVRGTAATSTTTPAAQPLTKTSSCPAVSSHSGITWLVSAWITSLLSRSIFKVKILRCAQDEKRRS